MSTPIGAHDLHGCKTKPRHPERLLYTATSVTLANLRLDLGSHSAQHLRYFTAADPCRKHAAGSSARTRQPFIAHA